ncbi:uncharacterized protein LOC113352523 [Papaver somniferum]|uniref:uncharacterized protein LOC113352523 n=1 Tax=Papaver somniferum TaxID=3469 RepID=UPI000E6FAC79|nr:uncharacterized protein LOC113352523 [Papaver somniferum]
MRDFAFYNLKWLEKYDNWSYKLGVRGTSDHGALFGGVNQNDKPKNITFRYQPVWTTHPNFRSAIQDSWEEECDGNPAFCFIIKLKSYCKGMHELASQQYNELLRIKSRVKWVKEGGENTAFFHANYRIRKAQNNINELENADDNLVTTQDQIADTLVSYYQKKFEEKQVDFVQEEIRDAVLGMEANSALGPDGFPGSFYGFA